MNLVFSPAEFVRGSQDVALLRLFWNPFSCPSVEVGLPEKNNEWEDRTELRKPKFGFKNPLPRDKTT